jgi:hypothetical protein
LFSGSNGADREAALGDAVATHASIVRISANWRRVAPKTPPAGFVAADPASPGYQWGTLDAAVKAASAHGLEPLLMVNAAPAWAEGPHRPANTPIGTWEPDPASFEAFAVALATRYDGATADPGAIGSTLPAVHLFEAWNEPNLSTYLNPQWANGRPVSADLYRNLLNGFYAGVKSVEPGATVVGGSLAPFGDPPGGSRVPPVTFTRRLFCLRGGALTELACLRPAHLDAFSHHPIAVGPPDREAESPLDATTPDLGRLSTVLRAAESSGRVLPRGRQKPLWVTEFWYDSDPPDPSGVKVAQQARWYAQDLYSFWQQGVTVALCLQVIDSTAGANFGSTLQSGVYYADGMPKPSQRALAFPFVTHRTGAFTVGVWGIAAHHGKVKIQALRRGNWTTLSTVRAVGPGQPFTDEVKLLRFAKLRARLGSETSLPFTQR